MVIPSVKRSNPPGNHYLSYSSKWFHVLKVLEVTNFYVLSISRQVKTICITAGMFSLYIIMSGKLIYTDIGYT